MKAYILPKNSQEGLIDITETIEKRVNKIDDTQEDPIDYSMGLKKIMDDYFTNQPVKYTTAGLDSILKRLETEMRDSELYSGEYPDDFPYDINDLLAADQYYSHLKTALNP